MDNSKKRRTGTAKHSPSGKRAELSTLHREYDERLEMTDGATSFRRWRGSGRPVDPSSSSSGRGSGRPSVRVTVKLVNLFRKCNPEYKYKTSANPRRCLTENNVPASNGGSDNDRGDYILYVNEVLISDRRHRYKVVDLLGHGTFGQVVKCQGGAKDDPKSVAIKVVKNKPAYFNQGLMEIRILQLLNQRTADADHQAGIVRLHDHFVFKRHLCLVFEVLSINLYELIKQNGFRGLSSNLVRLFTSQVLEALAVCASANIIHCVPDSDHQILTNRGFLLLSEVQQILEQEHEHQHGDQLPSGPGLSHLCAMPSAGRCPNPLLVAGYDSRTRCLVYERPTRLWVNQRATQSLVQFKVGPRRTLNRSRAREPVTAPRVLSVQATAGHRMLVASETPCDHHMDVSVADSRCSDCKSSISTGRQELLEARRLVQPADRPARPCLVVAPANGLACETTNGHGLSIKFASLFDQSGVRYTDSELCHCCDSTPNCDGRLGASDPCDCPMSSLLRLVGFLVGRNDQSSGRALVRHPSEGVAVVLTHSRVQVDFVLLCCRSLGWQCQVTGGKRLLRIRISAPLNWLCVLFPSRAASSAAHDEERVALDRLPDWTWELSQTRIRCLLCGLRNGAKSPVSKSSSEEFQVAVSSPGLRDDVVRAAIHAGFAPQFQRIAGANRGFVYSRNNCMSLSGQGTSADRLPPAAQDGLLKDRWLVTVNQSAHVPLYDRRGGSAASAACHSSSSVSRRSRDLHDDTFVGSAGDDFVSETKRVCRTWCFSMPSDHVVVRRVAFDKRTGQVSSASSPVVTGNCDVKPENILLSDLSSPNVRLIDFGSACFSHQTVYSYIQSRFYRAPEVLIGVQYTTAIDVWSLGCLTAELFLGLPLFPGSSEFNQLSRIADTRGPFPDHMVRRGKNATKYFNALSDVPFSKGAPLLPDEDQTAAGVLFELKSAGQYARERKVALKPDKKYFKTTDLHSLISQYPMKRSLSPADVQREMTQREALFGFLDGVLQLDPTKRWTAAQALQHPFVTGKDLANGRSWSPPAQVAADDDAEMLGQSPGPGTISEPVRTAPTGASGADSLASPVAGSLSSPVGPKSWSHSASTAANAKGQAAANAQAAGNRPSADTAVRRAARAGTETGSSGISESPGSSSSSRIRAGTDIQLSVTSADSQGSSSMGKSAEEAAVAARFQQYYPNAAGTSPAITATGALAIPRQRKTMAETGSVTSSDNTVVDPNASFPPRRPLSPGLTPMRAGGSYFPSAMVKSTSASASAQQTGADQGGRGLGDSDGASHASHVDRGSPKQSGASYPMLFELDDDSGKSKTSDSDVNEAMSQLKFAK